MKKILTPLFLFFILIVENNYAQFTPTYTGKPMYEILTKRAGVTLGIIKVELYPNIAYHHVKNFDSLVSVHFYDTTAFHRAIPNFMIQGGDPNSRHGAISTWGQGQAGQPTVNAEFTAAKHLRGRLSAARSTNINSATSQFFICVANYPSLDGSYSVYGRVISGLNYADTIALSPKMASYTNTPVQKVEMFITRIGSNDTVPNAPNLIAPASGTVGVDTSFSIQLKWSAVNDAVYYHLDVSTDSLFVYDVVKSQDLTTLTFNLNSLNSNSKYYWRVFANNGGHSTASAVWNLSTKGLESTSLISNSLNNSKFTISPNPSNGKFTFSHLDKGNTIEIFDLDGKLIKQIVAIDSSYSINLEGKDKGLYTYRILNNKKEVQRGKLILN